VAEHLPRDAEPGAAAALFGDQDFTCLCIVAKSPVVGGELLIGLCAAAVLVAGQARRPAGPSGGAYGRASRRAVSDPNRGFGGSQRPPAGYDTATMAGDVAELATYLGFDKFRIAGEDWDAAIDYAVAASAGAAAGVPGDPAARIADRRARPFARSR
jgi:hypothetical protein